MSGFDLPFGASAELKTHFSSWLGCGLVCACALITAASAATSGDEKLVPASATICCSSAHTGSPAVTPLQAPQTKSCGFAVVRVMRPPPGANTATSDLPKFEYRVIESSFTPLTGPVAPTLITWRIAPANTCILSA